MTIRRFASLLLATASALVLAGCETTAPEPSPNILRVGVTPNSPPMIYKSGNQIGGLEADLARKLGAELGKQVVFVERKWDALIPSLEANQIDIIMSNMTITSQREARVRFTSPYLAQGQTLLARSTELRFYAYPEVIRLTPKRVGVEVGTTGDAYVERFCPAAIRVPFSDPTTGASAVARGDIDVFVHDMPVVMRLASQFEGSGLVAIRKPLTREYLGWAVARYNTPLLQQANAAIAKWKASGELQSLANVYIPMR